MGLGVGGGRVGVEQIILIMKGETDSLIFLSCVYESQRVVFSGERKRQTRGES